MRTIGSALALLTASAVLSSAAVDGNAAATTKSPEPLVVRVQGGGFDWEDAAIGAATGFGASLVVVGGIAVRRNPAGKAHVQPYEQGEKSCPRHAGLFGSAAKAG